MAWDGNGSFTRTNGTQTGATAWASARDAGNNITATQHDTHDQDIATGIGACLTKNNESKPTATFAPNADAQYALGTSALRWTNLFLSGYVGDASGNELLKFSATASAINEVTIANASIGTAPTISATGGDTDIGLTISGKGAGVITIGASTNTITLAKATTLSSTLGVTGVATFNANPAISVAQASLTMTSSTGTNEVYTKLINTGGTYYCGVENSVSGSFGATAYDAVIFAPASRGLSIFAGAALQVRVLATASASNYLTFTGSNGGSPTINVSGGGLAITPATTIAGLTTINNQTVITRSVDTGDVALSVTNSAATSGNQFGMKVTLTADPNTSAQYSYRYVGNATLRAEIRTDGGFANFSANDVNLSTVTSKESFENVELSWSKVMTVRESIKYFKYKGASNKEAMQSWCCSPMAEDVENVYPEYVTMFDEANGLKGIREQPLMWELMVNVIDEVDTLRNQVATINTKLGII